MADSYISKIKLAGESTARLLKDAQARQDMTTLLGSHELTALGAAAWLDVDNSLTDGGTGLATAGTIKSYVDAAASLKLEIVVVDSLPPAGENTLGKLYLVPDAQAVSQNVKKEYVTLRTGAAEPYTYSWEQIGTSETDLTAYVKKTTEIAGVDLQDNITATELQDALGLKALAYKDKGSVTVSTADSITMDSYTPAGSVTVTLEDDAAENATIAAKIAYTPDGSVKLNAFTQTPTEIESTGSFTPKGTIAAKENGDFVALKSATFAKNANGVQIEGTNAPSEVTITPTKAAFVQSLKDSTTKAASFTEGAFTPASLGTGFYTAGTDASLSAGAQASLTDQTTSSFATEGIVASIDSEDSETLVFKAANPGQAVIDRGTFTPNTLQTLTGGKTAIIDVTKFNGGSKAQDKFSAEYLPEVNETKDAWIGYSEATAAAQAFTGEKYQNATTSDTALKEVAFTGTADNISVTGEYDKATANGATFTGKEVANLIPTQITYVPKKVKTASFSGTAATLTGKVNKTNKTVNVDFAVNA